MAKVVAAVSVAVVLPTAWAQAAHADGSAGSTAADASIGYVHPEYLHPHGLHTEYPHWE